MKTHKTNLQEMQSEMPESTLREGEIKREGRVREERQSVENNNQRMFITCSSEFIYIAFTLCVQNWNSCRTAYQF